MKDLTRFLEHSGEPSVNCAGLRIWIHGRQFPDLQDYWDGNWLKVTAPFQDHGSYVWNNGPFLHLGELSRWLEALETLHADLTGEAVLACVEPELSASIKFTSPGRGTFHVELTPNHLTQRHSFDKDVDQSCLPDLIDSLRGVLSQFPIRGRP